MAIQSSGLTIQLEAKETSSYPGTGSTWTNISSVGGFNFTNYGAVFQSTAPKHFLFNNNDDSIGFTGNTQYKFASASSKGWGVWINLNEVTATHVHPMIARKAGGNGQGYEFSVVNRNVVFKYKNDALDITLSTTTTPITLTGWHYIFVKFNPGSASDSIQIHVDGVKLVETAANSTIADGYNGDPYFGYDQSRSPANFYPGKIAAIHFYGSNASTTTALNNYNDQQAYYNSVNKTITETPATSTALFVDPTVSRGVNFVATPITATANQTEPTIVITTPNYVEITTSILVSATFPSNITIVSNVNINNTITDVLTASATFVDIQSVAAGTNASLLSDVFLASCLFVEPQLPAQPSTASALFVNPTINIVANYFQNTMALSPLFYDQFDQSSGQNFGSWTGSYTIGAGVTKELASGPNMGSMGEGQSWRFTNNSSANNKFVQYFPASANDTLESLWLTRNLTLECWIKPDYSINPPNPGVPSEDWETGSFQIQMPTGEEYVIRVDGLELNVSGPEVVTYAQYYTLGAYGSQAFATPTITNGNAVTNLYAQNKNNPLLPFDLQKQTEFGYQPPVELTHQNWNHIVVTAEPDPGITNGFVYKLYLNGTLVPGGSRSFVLDVASMASNKVLYTGLDVRGRIVRNSQTFTTPGVWFDQIAIFPRKLTSNEILDRYNFINGYSPNKTFFASPIMANATIADGVSLVQSNLNYQASAVTATGLFVDPIINTQVYKTVTATALTASAANTDVIIFYGWTIYATPIIASAESKEGFPLNTTYSDYLITNINPYRYVNFDTVTPYADYGTDADYSVTPTTVGGTIVNPSIGINGKSAKTLGVSYITDGVILKESEWNDSWGTGLNDWHSSFWVERASDDASTTGIRVLWNLNGYKDNQHIVLFQYQNKLHMHFNTQSGTPIQQYTDTLDLFDYNRHFIVIEHNNVGNSENTVKLYVDTNLVMTVNLGSYVQTTTNAVSADSGASDEANNYARLSLGCLITPYAVTSLPVVPTNTKLIIDEIYWNKDTISQESVTDLFNKMPDKTNTGYTASAFVSSALSVNPSLIITSIVIPTPFAGTALFVNPTITADREKIITATVLTATALISGGARIDNTTHVASPLTATGNLTSPIVVMTSPAQVMTATIKMPSQMLVQNQLVWTSLTPLVRYLRKEANTLINMYAEIK